MSTHTRSRTARRTSIMLSLSLAGTALAAGIAHADDLNGTRVTSGYNTSNGTGTLGPATTGAALSRDQIIARAKDWVTNQVDYSQSSGWKDSATGGPYRSDCSGMVSMAWALPTSMDTGTLPGVATPISESSLQEGDILNDTGTNDPDGGHAVIFYKWIDQSAGAFDYYYEGLSAHPAIEGTDGDLYSSSLDDHPMSLYGAYTYNNIFTTAPPTASLTGLTAGQVVENTVTLSASTADTSGTVNSVQYLVDGNVVATSSSAPFAASWNTVGMSEGAHSITVKAHNTAGQWGTASAAVTVDVVNGSLNGDANADLGVLGTDGSFSIRNNYSSGAGFDGGTTVSSGWQNYLGEGTSQGELYFADVNGDGLADMLVLGTDGTIQERLNLGAGKGFGAQTVISSGWQNYLGNSGQGRLYFADLDGDGRADLIVLGTDGTVQERLNYSNGAGFEGGTTISSGWQNYLSQSGQGVLYFS